MANDLQYLVRQHYQEGTEDQLFKTLTAFDLAGMVEIPDGTTKNLPYIQMISTGDYTKYTNQTLKDVKTGNDQIVINTTPMVSFGLDDIDVQEDYIKSSSEVTDNASYQIKRRIDGDFFSQVANAKWKYDANGFGRNTTLTSLSPVTLTTGASQNISTVYGKAKAGLTNTGVNAGKLALCVDDFAIADLTTLGLQTSGMNVPDVSYTRGFGGMFGGMKTYGVSTLYATTTFDCATNPTANDYVDIQGVRFTFVATPTNPGDIDIGADANATMANLILAINGTGTPGATTYTDISSQDRALLEGVTATDGTDLITLVSKNGAILAQSSMTAAANDFRVQVIYHVIMEKGAIKMAFKGVKAESAREPLKLVTNYHIYARYGFKTPELSKSRLCVIPVVSLVAEA
jgi:hypothetical protein